jgi:hypothetical protein
VAGTADEVFYLLSTSQSRWRTLRASGRVWSNPTLLSEAAQALLARRRAEGQTFAIISNQSDTPLPDENEEEWQLWLARPFKRAKFAAGRGGVDVVFHESTWWSNALGISRTNGGAINSGHGDGPGANLIRTADYVPLIDVGDISPGSWLGRETLTVTVSIRRGLEVRRGPGLHGLVIGDADPILLDIDRERGVILRAESSYRGSVYRDLEMNEVAFDEEFPTDTFEIRPLSGLDWSSTREEDSTVNSDRQWLDDRGLLVAVEQESSELFWAHLACTSSSNPSLHNAPKYGRGTTLDEAVASARRRYEVEELGIEPSA